jgi:putative heme transporter
VSQRGGGEPTAVIDPPPGPAGPRPRRHWQVAAVLLSAVAIATGVYAGRRTLGDSLHALVRLDWTWFLAAIGCEAVSLSAFGLSRRRLLRADGQHAGLGSVMAITYASNALSMTIPFAGAELAVVFS